MPALLTLGGMGVALHYEMLTELFDGVPLIMAYGMPVSGKSLAVHIAMSIIGEAKSVGGDCYSRNMQIFPPHVNIYDIQPCLINIPVHVW